MSKINDNFEFVILFYFQIEFEYIASTPLWLCYHQPTTVLVSNNNYSLTKEL